MLYFSSEGSHRVFEAKKKWKENIFLGLCFTDGREEGGGSTQPRGTAGIAYISLALHCS